jgi:hypothetical protein
MINDPSLASTSADGASGVAVVRSGVHLKAPGNVYSNSCWGGRRDISGPPQNLEMFHVKRTMPLSLEFQAAPTIDQVQS